MSSALTTGSRIFVAGHRGLVGSAIVRALNRRQFSRVIVRSRSELDLRDARAVDDFFQSERPEFVILAAAKVGGILANDTRPADFILENLQIQNSVIDASFRHDVRKLLFLGSSCIYPKLAPQPISEDSLLSGPLEPTNEWYAVAKIAGIKTCQALRKQYGFNAVSAMPTNLYGPGDNFDLRTSHVLPALLRKIHEAKAAGRRTVEIWGTGTPRREFLHVDDLAEACLFLLSHYDRPEIVNVGWGQDLSIAELAHTIAGVVGFTGTFVFDSSKPDGTPRKLLDTSRLTTLGWRPSISLESGIRSTYEWYLQQLEGGASLEKG